MDPYIDDFQFTPRNGRSLRVIVVGAGIGGLTASIGVVASHLSYGELSNNSQPSEALAMRRLSLSKRQKSLKSGLVFKLSVS